MAQGPPGERGVMTMSCHNGQIVITWKTLTDVSSDDWSKRWGRIRPVVKELVPEWYKYLSNRDFMMLPGTAEIAEQLHAEVAKIDPGFKVIWEQES